MIPCSLYIKFSIDSFTLFQYRNVLLQICICMSAIGLLEWRNCLMYIQDSVAFSEYCLMICLGLAVLFNIRFIH